MCTPGYITDIYTQSQLPKNRSRSKDANTESNANISQMVTSKSDYIIILYYNNVHV